MFKKIIRATKIRAHTLVNKIISYFASYFYKYSPKNILSSKEILEYRKKIMVYDIFIFFNELELLEIRLNILDPYVDYFVIVESTKTFTGKTKPLHYKENIERFKKWNHKIIYHTTTDTPDTDNEPKCDQKILNLANKNLQVPKGQIHWLREFYQKEMMKYPLVNKLTDNDFCFISDIDEIWNPQTKIDYSKNSVFKFKQKVYAYYVNNRSSETWSGTFATKYKNIKNHSLISLDSISETYYTYIENGGWHFTNMGGLERIKQKIESYGHQEFNTKEIKDKIKDKINSNIDFVGRNFKFWKDESDLPKYILDNKEKYKNLFK